MRRTYRYRLYPTKQQSIALEAMLDVHRELYNAALEERKDAWRLGQHRIKVRDQEDQLTEIRRLRPDLACWSTGSERAALRRLDRAFDGFFRRVKAGRRAGYPRFKGRDRFDSVEWPDQWGWTWREHLNRLRLQGLGEVKVRVHRPTAGEIKTVIVRREGQRWFVCLSCDGVPIKTLPVTDSAIGLDMGIAAFAVTNDGEFIPHPRPLRRARRKLERAQQALARKVRGSNRRRKARTRVAELHRKVRRTRRDFHHKTAHALVQKHDLIAVESLAIANMTRSARGTVEEPGRNVAAKAALNYSILDAGWGGFLRILVDEAEEADRLVIAGDPYRSSQTCSVCGVVDSRSRVSQAEFVCTGCGRVEHADVNAAQIHLKRAGLARQAVA